MRRVDNGKDLAYLLQILAKLSCGRTFGSDLKTVWLSVAGRLHLRLGIGGFGIVLVSSYGAIDCVSH